jgi:hypothetical protein
MSLIKGLQRRPSIAIATVLAFLVLGGIAGWIASRQPAKASAHDKQHLQKQLRKGVGSEVRFALTPDQAADAVASAAEFIHWRSGLKISDETKKKLAQAESDVLSGASPYITISELTDNMTAVVVDRLATLTDEEIQWATEASTDTTGQIRSRADGKWGVLTKKDLVHQAKAGRQWSKRGDFALRDALHSMIEGEVNDRLSALVEASPEQFGQAGEQGVTPTQALIIAYSVATDDPLTDSRSDIQQAVVQQRMDNRETREQRKAQKNVSLRPYGPNGFLHPSAPQLFFNKASVDSLLNLSKGGKK